MAGLRRSACSLFVLVGVLVAFLGAQFAEQLHAVAVAHIACEEHGNALEDVPVGASVEHERVVHVESPPADAGGDHHACGVLPGLSSAGLLPPEAPWVLAPPPLATVARLPPPRPAFVRAAPISYAPKTSPPVT